MKQIGHKDIFETIREEVWLEAVFGAQSTQDEVFEEAAKDPVIDLFKGFHTTIFAYGQTGSGKSSIRREANSGLPRPIDAPRGLCASERERTGESLRARAYGRERASESVRARAYGRERTGESLRAG